jgi:hypothetical protein
VFFSEEKNQKTFIIGHRGSFKRHKPPNLQKSFASFLQKRRPLFVTMPSCHGTLTSTCACLTFGPMLAPRLLILHYQAACLGNAARLAWSTYRRDSLVIGVGGGLLFLHEIDVLHSEIAARAVVLARDGATLLLWASGFAAAIGAVLGWRAVRSVRYTLARPWLAVLPWPQTDRRPAVRWGCLLPGLWQAGFAAACTGMLFSWAGWARCAAAAGLGGGAFCIGFLAAVMAAAPEAGDLFQGVREHALAPSAKRKSFVCSLSARLDVIRPQWCSRWALARLSARARLGWCMAAILVGATGCTIGAVQAWPFAAITAGWLAAHMIFLATLNVTPLVSPVLRAQPIGFVAAAAGVARAPLALSCLTFGAGSLAAMAVASARWSMVLIATGLLLGMNLVAGIVSAGLPGKRLLALTVYGLAVALTLYEQLEYGDVIFGCFAAFSAFLFVQGRKAFRGI